MNSSIRGFPILMFLLIVSCVKPIAIHIINVECLDFIGKAFGEPFQLSIHFSIFASLHIEPGNKIGRTIFE
jgi:hypothetical protein